MCLLDRLQQAYSEATNKEYQSGEKNRYQIILNDRKFFTILRAIKSTAKDIKKIYESDLSLKEKSDAMAKMRFANVDWQLYSRILETENQKMVASKEK